MAIVDGGELVVRALKTEGVEYIFSLSGTQIMPVYNACIGAGIEIIATRHEQAAVHMADGWARVSSHPGVALLTAGPGVTNGVTGIACAFEASSPILVLAGRSPLAQLGMGSFQEMDQMSLVTPITKWAGTVYETRRIPEFISIAFRHALSGRPGPVFLDIPEDVLDNQIGEEQVCFPQGYRTSARAYGEPALVREAVDMVGSAQRLVVIAGSGVWWSRAAVELQEFIEAARLPLVLTRMGRGAVPEDHPLCFGPTRVGLKEADVVLVVGTRLNYTLGYGRPPLFAEGVKVIQVDIEPEEIGRNRPVDIGIIGDAGAVLSQMTEEIRNRGRSREELPWIEVCRAYVQSRRQTLEYDLNSDRVPIHPLRLCREIADFLDRDATLVMDGGEIAIFGANVLRVFRPGHWLDNGPMGGLGSGIPFGAAAKLARPEKQVLVLSGDGSFGFNAMEFDTAVRHRLPLVVVIGNDASWGLIKHGQEDRYGRVIATELGFVRYDRMVEALGGYGEYVDRPEDIRPALERAFESGVPACLNVRTDPSAAISRR